MPEELENYLSMDKGAPPRLNVADVARPRAPATPSTVASAAEPAATAHSQATTLQGTLPPTDPSSDAEVDGMDVPPIPDSFGGCGGKAIPDLDQSPGYSPATPVSNDNGTVGKQPLIPEMPEHEHDDSLWEDIPDMSDALAPKPQLGENSLSRDAIRSRAKRIFTPRADGSRKVSDEIWQDWHSKGPKKKLLEDIFRQCGYDADSWD